MANLALVGLGAFGRFCLQAFSLMPNVQLVAVCDVDLARCQWAVEQYGVKAYDSLDVLLKNQDIEIVALNTPPYLHAEQGLAILNAGKHLFCEKPLALSIEDAAKLLHVAAANQRYLTVNYVMRHNSFWNAAAKLAQSGIFGKLTHMDLVNHAAGLELNPEHWFWDKRLSGGIWIEHGVHFFDAFAMVAGTKGEIQASLNYARPDGIVERVESLASYGNAAAHFYHAFNQSSKTEQTTARLSLENAYLTLREWIPTSLEILTGVAPEQIKGFLQGTIQEEIRDDGRYLIRSYAPEGKSAIYQAAIQASLQDFIEAIGNAEHHAKLGEKDILNSLQMAIAATNGITL